MERHDITLTRVDVMFVGTTI